MSPESFEKSFEQRGDLKLELEKLKALYEKRSILQQHWSELFEKTENIEFRYPNEVKFDEQRRYRSDRGFLTSEDKEEFEILDKEKGSLKEQINELDKENLKRRFELGLKYLTEINKREDVVWREISEHKPDSENSFDILYSKEWRAKIGDNIAEISMTGENTSSFFEGMKHVAGEIGDTKVLEALEKWPKERKLDFNNIRISFSISPRSKTKIDRELIPALSLTKRFDYYNKELDQIEVDLPMSYGACVFPKIKEEEQEQARNEMIALSKKIGITFF